MKLKPAGARYPYGVNTYESLTTHLNNESAKHKSPDTVLKQLRHSQAYDKKVDKQKEKVYHRQERALALTNHWKEADKHLNYKNDYEKILEKLKNTKLKGLTHEQLESIEKQWQALFNQSVR